MEMKPTCEVVVAWFVLVGLVVCFHNTLFVGGAPCFRVSGGAH